MKSPPRVIVAFSLFALFALALTQFFPGQHRAEAAQTKVGMCHREGNGSYHPIRIASPAVPAHLAHGDVEIGGTCSVGAGECKNDGTYVSCEEDGAVCDAIPGTPLPEVCDNLDNDCDGATDDGIPSTPTVCGTGACAATGATSCVAGAVVNSCTPGPSSPEVCDNLDNNCNGSTDEGLGTISCGVGICQNIVNSCVSGVIQVCTPNPAGVEGSVCNGLDDDCDGIVDDGCTP